MDYNLLEVFDADTTEFYQTDDPRDVLETCPLLRHVHIIDEHTIPTYEFGAGCHVCHGDSSSENHDGELCPMEAFLQSIGRDINPREMIKELQASTEHILVSNMNFEVDPPVDQSKSPNKDSSNDIPTGGEDRPQSKINSKHSCAQHLNMKNHLCQHKHSIEEGKRRRRGVLDHVPVYEGEEIENLINSYCNTCWDAEVLDMWIALDGKLFSYMVQQYLDIDGLLNELAFIEIFGKAEAADIVKLFDYIQKSYRKVPFHHEGYVSTALHLAVIALKHQNFWQHLSELHRFIIVICILSGHAGYFGVESKSCMDIMNNGGDVKPVTRNMERLLDFWWLFAPYEAGLWHAADRKGTMKTTTRKVEGGNKRRSSVEVFSTGKRESISSAGGGEYVPVVQLYAYMILEMVLAHVFPAIDRDAYEVFFGPCARKIICQMDPFVFNEVVNMMERRRTTCSFSIRVMGAIFLGHYGHFLLCPKGLDRYLFSTGMAVESQFVQFDYMWYVEKSMSTYEPNELLVCQMGFAEGQENFKRDFIDCLLPTVASLKINAEETIMDRVLSCYRTNLLFINIMNDMAFEMMHGTFLKSMTLLNGSTNLEYLDEGHEEDSEGTEYIKSDNSKRTDETDYCDGPSMIYCKLKELTTRIVSEKLHLKDKHHTDIELHKKITSDFASDEALYKPDDWDFQILDIWRQTLSNFFPCIMEGIIDLRKLISDKQFQRFFPNATVERIIDVVCAIQNTYKYIPYHNAGHAGMVCHHTVYILKKQNFWSTFRPVSQFLILISALAHDVGHFGCSSSVVQKSFNNGVSVSVIENDLSEIREVWIRLPQDTRSMWWSPEEFDTGELPFPGDEMFKDVLNWPKRPYVELYHIVVLERILKKFLNMDFDVADAGDLEIYMQLIRVHIVRTDAGIAREFHKILKKRRDMLHVDNRISHALCLSDIANTLLTSKGADRYLLAVAVAAETATTNRDPLFYLNTEEVDVMQGITPTTKLFNIEIGNFSFADGQETFMQNMVMPLLEYVKDLSIHDGVTFEQRLIENARMAQKIAALIASQQNSWPVLGKFWRHVAK